MRKIIKEYNVYGFEELDKSIQESILERYIEKESELYCETCLYGDMVELAHNLLQEYFKGSEYVDIHYDLGYSQGSGAMIEFTIDLKDLNNKYNLLKEKEVKELEIFGETEIKVYHNNNSHYCHEFTFYIDYNDFTMYDYEWEVIKDIYEVNKKIEEMIDLFKKDIITMNKEFTRNGYSYLEDREMFEENAMLYIKDLEFLESGEEFYE